MKLPFRQGIVDCQKDPFGLPQFLIASSTPSYVAFNVSTTPTTVTIADGASNYLLVFSQDVPAAWGPVVSSIDNYLYWDINTLTSLVSYGITTIEPVAHPSAPSSPVVDQHWFDLTSMKMKRWSGTEWQHVIRAFAGKVANGNTNSIQAELPGQPWKNAIALQVTSSAGYISTDIFGTPLRMPSLEFVTSNTPVRFNTTVGTTGVLAVLPNAFIPIKAGENIPAMSLVYFSATNTVSLASSNPSLSPQRVPIGIVQEPLSANQVGVVTQSGEISYDAWNWAGHIGNPVFCDNNGQITLTRPTGLMVYRVGFIKSPKTIVFQIDAETTPQVYSSGPSDVIVEADAPLSSAFSINGLGEKVWTLSLPASSETQNGFMSSTQAGQLTIHESRLDAAEIAITGKAMLGHIHTIADVSLLQASLDDKAPLTHDHSSLYSLLGHTHTDFAAVSHLHSIAQVTDLQTELNSKAARIHVNTFDEVFDGVNRTSALDVGTGSTLRTVLGAKVDKVLTAVVGNFASFVSGGGIQDSGYDLNFFDGRYPQINHTHSMVQISGLDTALAGKADSIHSHDMNQVMGLVTALAGKSNVGHTHGINEIYNLQTTLTNLQTEINGKANTAHSHDYLPLAGGTLTGQVKFFNGFGPQPGISFVGNDKSGFWFDPAQPAQVQLSVDGELLAKFQASDTLPVVSGIDVTGYVWATAFGVTTSNYPRIAADAGRLALENSTNSIILRSDGVLTSSLTNYEALVLLDDDLVNKKYVDDAVSSLPIILSADDLTDVDTTTSAPIVGDALIWNGTSWVPGPAGSQQPKPRPLTTTTTTSTALDLGSSAHHNSHYRCTAVTAITITIQPESFWTGTQQYYENDFNPTSPAPMPIGGTIIVGKHNTGDVTFVAGSGVTINTPDSLSITNIHGKATLIKVAPDVWDLEGNIGT